MNSQATTAPVSARVASQYSRWPSARSGSSSCCTMSAVASVSSAGTPQPVVHWTQNGIALTTLRAAHSTASEPSATGSRITAIDRKRDSASPGAFEAATATSNARTFSGTSTRSTMPMLQVSGMTGAGAPSVWRRALAAAAAALSAAAVPAAGAPHCHRRPAPGTPTYTARLLVRSAPSTGEYDRSVRQEIRGVVGALLRAGGGVGQTLHRVGGLRPAAGAVRHRGLAGPRRDAQRAAASCRRPTSRPSARGMAQIAGEIAVVHFAWSLDLEDVHLNIEKRLTDLVGDAGKRLHTGPLAQRPGRHRHPPVAARGDRRHPRPARRAAARAARPGRARTPTRSCPASRTCRSPSRSPSATT